MLLRVELDGEGVDLLLELREAMGQPVAVLTERFGQRDHRLDQPALAVVGGRDVVHAFLQEKWRWREQIGCRALPATNDAHLAGGLVGRLTA